jgi:hypothetical protein
VELQDIYFIAEIVGVVAIIGSLLFVGGQMRQNTMAMQASVAADMARSWQEVVLSSANDQELTTAIELVNNATDETELPDSTMFYRYIMWLSAGMKNAEFSFYRHQSDQLEDGLWSSALYGALTMFNTPTKVKIIWPIMRNQVSPKFAQFMDGAIAKGAPDTIEEMAQSPLIAKNRH